MKPYDFLVPMIYLIILTDTSRQFRFSPSAYKAVGHEVIVITNDLTLTNTINSYSVS